MDWLNNLLAILTVFISGIVFFFIFRNMFKELVKEGLLGNRDKIFLFVTVTLVFVIYLFLETLHH